MSSPTTPDFKKLEESARRSDAGRRLGMYDDDAPIIAPNELVEAAFQANEVADLARTSLDFLAALCIPQVFEYFFPPIFLSIWSWLTSYVQKERDFSQLALGLPRGFGKTMVIKLFIIYCVLFTKKHFILVLCETTTKAKNIIADVADMLDEGNVKKTFGDWRAIPLSTDTQELKKFHYRGRDIILMGAGVESGIRGITIKNERPDVMIFDDIQSRSCAESQVQSDTLEREMYGTAMKAKSPKGCLFVFIANMYPTKWSILRRLKTNPNWMKYIVGGILDDGTSLWEELQPIKQLLTEFENDLLSGHPEIFYSEVLNDENAQANNRIDLSAIKDYPYGNDEVSAGNFIIIDPSNDKQNSDAVSIGYFEVYDALPALVELEDAALSPGDTIRNALRMALRKGCGLIVVEANAYQYSLLYWFKFVCEQMGIVGIECVPIYSGSHSKTSRILKMFKAYTAQEFFVHPRCRAAVHLQITQYNPLKTINTDGILDLLTYAPRVLEMYGEYVANRTIIQEQESLATEVVEFNSPF
jgi:hypothetical protein